MLILIVVTLVSLHTYTHQESYMILNLSSTVPYYCDVDSALFFDKHYNCRDTQSQLIDACKSQVLSKYPNSSHVFTKAKCLDSLSDQYDQQGCKQRLECLPNFDATCSNKCELRGTQQLQECTDGGGDLSRCSYKTMCTSKCEVSGLINACVNGLGDLSKCSRGAQLEQECRSKCATQDTQSINECIAAGGVCVANSSTKDYIITRGTNGTACQFIGTNKGSYTRQDCIDRKLILN